MTSPRRLLLVAALFLAVAQAGYAGNYSWTTAGPEPGPIWQIAVDRQNSDVLYAVAGYSTPKFFKSLDRGGTWSQSDQGLPAYLYRFVQDPSDSRILYAASNGVFKTTDSGRHWFRSSSGLPALPIFALAAAPSEPGLLYASGTLSGIASLYRSTDGAASWTAVPTNLVASSVNKLLVDPLNEHVLYTVADGRIQKSMDGGVNWTFFDANLPPMVQSLAIDPSDGSILYAATWSAGVFKRGPTTPGWTAANAGIENYSIWDLAVDRDNPRKLFAAGASSATGPGGLFVTFDGAAKWSPADLGSDVKISLAVAIDPRNSSLVYAGAGQSFLRGGVVGSSDGGSTWISLEKGLSGYFSYAVASHPMLPRTAYAVSGSRVHRTDDGGRNWLLLAALPFGPLSLLIDPTAPTVLYCGTAGAGVYKSVDGGISWNPPNTGMPGERVNRLAIARSSPNILFAVTDTSVHKSSDGGSTWSRVLEGSPRAVAVDPLDHQIVYAGLSAYPSSGLLRSDDGGATWTPPTSGGAAYVSDIAIHPSAPGTVYVASGAGILRSTDRGLSFAPAGLPEVIDGNPFRLALAANDPQTVYLLTDFSRVFRTANGAASWSRVPFVPSYVTLDFSISAMGRTLYASTTDGVFQFERSFLDVPDADPFWSFVDILALSGISTGCGDGNFCPGAVTSRAQAAPLLLKSKNGAGYAPAPATGTLFSDVPPSSFASAWIEELARQGITTGCGGGNFCPDAPVSRADAAVLLLRTKHGSAYAPPPATGAVFTDVPADSLAAAWIEVLFAEGITAGCGGGNYCPEAPATRAQMAAFLVRTFGLE